jgi:hypothetical protein
MCKYGSEQILHTTVGLTKTHLELAQKKKRLDEALGRGADGEGQPASCGVSTHEEWSGRLSGYTIITVLKLAVDGAGESGSFTPSHFWRKFAISTYNTHGNQLVF